MAPGADDPALEPPEPAHAADDFQPVPIGEILAALDAEKNADLFARRQELEAAIRQHWLALRQLVREYRGLTGRLRAGTAPHAKPAPVPRPAPAANAEPAGLHDRPAPPAAEPAGLFEKLEVPARTLVRPRASRLVPPPRQRPSAA
ncbi:MAG TPA: hypothetical protein VEB20_10185 [Azospirillaceae bacterium]|nr:hypothetical protein [Azospirillaceae bacterium]